MALQKENNYCKIVNVYWDLSGKNSFGVQSIVDNTVVKFTEYPNYYTEQPMFFEINKSEGSFIKQAYEYLKTLPEYADAVDC